MVILSRTSFEKSFGFPYVGARTLKLVELRLKSVGNLFEQPCADRIDPIDLPDPIDSARSQVMALRAAFGCTQSHNLGPGLHEAAGVEVSSARQATALERSGCTLKDSV